MVSDDQVQAAVDAIIEANQTKNHGDGKIFILPILDAVRVRTGETGEEAIDTVTV